MTGAPPGPAALLRELESRARKSLGQHFLVNGGVARAAVVAAEVGEGSPVLEIGPGLGALTGPLVEAGASVVAVERDETLAAWVGERFPTVRVVRADAMEVDFPALLPQGGWTCVSNLPYNVGTHLVSRMVQAPDTFRRLVVMLQREVVDRLLARPGTRAYGSLSLEIQAWAAPSLVVRVRPGSFHPPPRVDSAVLRLDLRGVPETGGASWPAFRRVVRAAFATRRKTMRNALAATWGREAAEAALGEAGIRLEERAEQLDAEAFGRLARALVTRGDGSG